MPSDYSPNLRIELIANGEQSGAWGNTTNINLGTLIEDAISGYVAVTTTAGNQALTALNGAPDQSRNMLLSLDTTTGSAFNVFIPPVSKMYVVKNNALHTVTVYCSTDLGDTIPKGFGIAIPAQKTLPILSDGTNVFSAVNYNTFLGTTNQVNVSDVNGDITFSLPQNIDSDATIQFGQLVVTTATTLTGTTSTPTAAENTSTNTIASTAFVDRLRSLSTPTTSPSGGTASIGDRGSLISSTGEVTVPANIFSARDVFSIYNNTALPFTIAQGSGLTLRLVGSANTGNRALAQRGLATVVFLSPSEAVISGGGVT
jgi:hypothetical protein